MWDLDKLEVKKRKRPDLLLKRSTGGVAALPRTAHTATLRSFFPKVKKS
jgi:hypothetical protein